MSEQIADPTPNRETAEKAFRGFIEKIGKSNRVVCLHDSDADGVTAGVVWQRAMERLGFTNLKRISTGRERNAFTAETAKIVSAEEPQFLFVLDLGSQPQAIVENAPTCFIDHHRPGGALKNDTLISAYTWNPVPNTSLIVYDLFSTLTDIGEYDWIAAIGTISDLGEKAPFELLETTRKKYTAKWLKEAVSLVNAARRASKYEPETAAKALLENTNPKDLVNSDAPELIRLRDAKAEVNAELAEARKVAPVFAGKVALINIDSPCQIHPLIAQSWRTRLPKYIAICANKGYMPGRVNFAARTSAEGVSVLDFLRGIKLNVTEGSYGQGHDQASGGSLPFETWNELLAKLGFPESTFVKIKTKGAKSSN
jgi:single-stranded-DNA-specific exonuclease